MISLPIDSYIPDILTLWKKEKVTIISASAGSGKTTRLPWAMAQESNKKIIVLEPRKLAAKMAATRMSDENQLTLGKEIGYAYRDDINFNKESRVIFFTEGTFIRFINDEAFLKDVDTIIFDEFHERHLDTDLCLALIRNKFAEYPHLKISLMSATIDHQLAQELNASIIEIKAQNFEVKIHYLPNQPSIQNQELAVKVLNTIAKLPSSGDILVFLPGMREILKAQDYLKEKFGHCFILHSEVEKSQQEKIMNPSTLRKIILSTNIAESSLTIPGVKYVIDSGIARVSEFNQWSGIKTLVDRPITQSSAIQRMYRAGRTQDGECFRLYSEFDFNQREKFTIPEILTTDLTDLYLISSYYHHHLLWITPPPIEKWKQAQALCQLLGMISHDKVSEIGEFALSYNLNIRIARMLWEGRSLSQTSKMKILEYVAQHITNEDSKYLQRRLQSFLKDVPTEIKHEIDFEKIILSGMIDQVAKYRREHHDFIHYSGATFKAHNSLSELEEGLYVLTHINHRRQVQEVLSIEEDWLIEIEPFPLIESNEFIWEKNGINSKIKISLGSIIIEEISRLGLWSDLNKKEKEEFILRHLHRFDLLIKEFKESSLFLRALFYMRIQKIESSFNPDFETFLSFSNGILHDCEIYLKQMLEDQLSIDIERLIPRTITINNKNFHIDYRQEASIQGFIQDFYGLKETPTFIENIALTLIILGPHKRPIQYTKDLAGFWSGTYKELLKEFLREYPRHHWSDNPSSAPPILLKRLL